MRTDTGSRTEADAAAFERHFASEPYDDRPSASDFPRPMPTHTCWRNGGVECRACEIEEQAEEAALVDPCNYCPHDNTEHAEDGCRLCGCAVPQ